MKKVLFAVCSFFSIICAVLLINSCEVGLGESVDSESPTVAISYPPEQAVIRGTFVAAGTCNDDKGIKSVKVSIYSPSDENLSFGPYEASVSNGKKWRVNLNEHDELKYANYNGWQIPDGTYTIKVSVEDNAGRTQETPATQTVDIDNTAPIFIVSAPGKKYSNGSGYYKYGSAFTVSGTIAEKHKPDLTVNIYDESSSENPIVFTEKEVDTSGTSSIEFARYIKNSASQKVVNYANIYKDEITDDSGTKNFKLSVLLSDNAREYKNPEEKANLTVGGGNTTSKVFLYDEVYTTYQSAQVGLGLTAEDFKNILNGTKTGEIFGQGKATGTCEEVRNSLNNLFLDTTQTKLAFSLNPNANPVYSISGFALSGTEFNSESFASNASKGSTITASVSAGENGTNILPSSLKMWLYRLDSVKSSYTNEKIAEEIRKLENAVYNGTSDIITDESGVSSILDWTLIASNENSNDSSATSYTYSGKIPVAMKQGDLYIIAVTGTDADSAYLSQETFFGFKGVVSGMPPTLSFENVTDQTYKATSDEISFNVISKSEEVQLTKVQAVVSVKDESSGKTIEGLYKSEKVLEGVYSDKWTFKLSDVDDYSNIQLTKECGKSYLYTIKFTAENISGTYSETLNLHVDAIKPVVNITSVTPYVSGSDRTDISGIDENKYYLNGNITVNGSVVESNLKDVSYAVYVDGKATDISGTLGSVYQYQIPIDTTKLEDKKEIKIVITATDNVENSESCDTTLYNDPNGSFVVLQGTDKPQIILKNAYSTGTNAVSILDGNRFTNATSNKIEAEIKDDDGIAKVIVTVYKPDGKTVIDGPKEIYSASGNYKTSYNLNYELPAKNGKAIEGIYGIKIEVQDSTYKSESDNLRTQSTGIFYVGVDTADPVITEIKVGESGATIKENSIELSGSASDTNGIKTVKIVDTSKENNEETANYSDEKWSSEIKNLSDGLHALQITATDTTGRTKTITRNITIDTKEPNVEPKTENASVYLDQSPYITLIATAEDVKNDGYASGVANVYVCAKETDEKPSYTIEAAGWVSMSKTSSGYSATINLSEAAYKVSDDKVLYAWFAAVDNAGNCKVSENPTKIVCDASVPVISEVKSGETVLLSGGTLKSKSEDIALKVTVTDTNVEKLVVVSIGSSTGSSGSSTSTSGTTTENEVTITEESTTESKTIYNVTYKINTNGSDSKVVFKAIDKNGRESENFTVIAKCDKTVPTVEITNPSSKQIQTTSLTVNGNYTEENLESIKVTLTPIDANGEADSSRSTQTAEASVSVGISSGSGTWNAKFYELSEGAYKITVSVLDEYSNSGSAEKTFTLDVTAPTLSVTTYPTSATNGSFELSGSVSDTYLSDVTVSDSLDTKKSWPIKLGSDGNWTLELTPSADGTGTDVTKNYTKDGSHIYTITAKDQAGNVTTKTVQVITDVTAPVWNTPQKDASSKETKPYIRNIGMTATVNGAETTLYGSATLTFAAKAMDLTSGIKELVYKVDGNLEVPVDNANFTVDFENGSHTVTLKAFDEAGNESKQMTWMFFVDSYAPSTAILKSVDSDSESDIKAYADQTSQKLVNGKAAVVFSLSAYDYGEDSVSTTSSTASGIASVVLTKIGNKTLNPVIDGKLSSDSTYSIEIPAEKLSSGAVTVKVTDKAGNFSEFALFNLDLDNIAPSVTLNAPKDADSNTKDKTDVNGTIVLNGTSSDNKSLGSDPVVVEYNTTSSSAAEGWKTLSTNYENSSYSATLDTTNLTDKSNVYIRATATDSAGNTKTAELTLYVNQNTDRPIIQITSIDDDSAWLTSKTLIGTITDDDGISSFQISEDGSSYSDVRITNGSWSYDITGGDGEDKKVYFKVTDTAGTTFTTASTTKKTPYYRYAKTTSADAGYSEYGFENTSALSLKLDTQIPLLGTAGLDIKTTHTLLAETSSVASTALAGSNTAGVASNYEISTSRYAGGNFKYIKFYVPAYDVNIDKVTVSISDANGNNETAILKDVSTGTETAITGTEITLTKTAVVSNSYTYYESKKFSISEVSTGQKNVTFVVTDKAGNSTTKTESFYIDNSVGENSITITSPDSSDEVTGTVNVVGITSDVGIGIESVEWLVPPKGTKNNSDAELSALEGWTNSNNQKSTGLFNFQFLAGDQYDLVNYDNEENYDVTHDSATNIYTIPLYLKATDKLGNIYIKKDFHITHNPDADRPSTEISYPTSNDYDSGESYITLSGTIRVNGTVQIPSKTTDVGKVFIQIGTVKEDGTIDWSGNPTDGTPLAKEFKTLGGIVIPTENSDGTYSITDTLSGTTYSKTTYVTQDWWGIPCVTKTSTWNISLNTNGDLNPTDSNGTTNIAVRACAINKDGKMGLWTDVKTAAPVIHIDQNAPSQIAVMRKYSKFSDSALEKDISLEKNYVSEMYLKGTYYLVVTLSDNDSLNENTIRVTRGNITIQDYKKSAQSNDSSGRKTQKIYIPIETTSMTTSSVNYTVYVEDSSGHSSTNTYTFYIDNTAPAFNILKGNEQNLLGENVPVIQNSNYAYTLSGSMTEAGSGLERVLFYFLRQDGADTSGSSKRVLDAMAKYDDYKSDTTDFYVSSLAEYKVSQGNETFTMYGKTYSGSLDYGGTTFTISDSSYSSNVHIRAGGLIYIGGEYHKISSINGSSIIFEGEVPDSITVSNAGFPYGQVVDCAEKATFDSSNKKYNITGDDGDGMPETMTKVATTYSWDGTIYSDVMSDGPCEIVLIAFDKAGNVSGKTIKTSIQNNAPRIAKLHIGTDLTGDGKYSDSEFNTYSFISGDAKQDLFKDSVDFKTSDSDYGYEKPFKITNGLAVVPEFTGGNGDIYMKFLNDASSVKNYQKKNGDSDNSFYPAENDNSKVTATFSVNKNTTTGLENTTKLFVVNDENLKNLEDGTGKSMSFTFWDSTDGTTCGIDSNYCFVRISDFTLGLKDSFAPTTVVNPFYWNSLTDNSIYGSDKAKSYKDLQGHIELEADLPGKIFGSDKTGVYDLDPKVSGKVTLTGYAYDDQRLGKITVQFTDGLLATETEVATYSSGTWNIQPKTITSDGYEFTVSSNEEDGAYFNQNGHKVYWTLSLDTEKITNFAKADVSVIVKATDAKGANGGNVTSTTNVVNATTENGMRTIIDGTTNYPVYKMDVVPYITKITTSLSAYYSSNPSVYARSALGKYVTREGESVQFTGFNIGTNTAKVTIPGMNETELASGTVNNSSVNNTIALDRATSYTKKGATSGEISVTVNGVSALNNKNNNDAKGSYSGNITDSDYLNAYNRQPNGLNNNILSDDLYIDVWEFINAAEPKNGKSDNPTMKISPKGRIGISYSNAVVYFSAPFIGNGKNVSPENAYSQTAIAKNYGWFTNNTFCWDQYGYPYAAAQSPDTDTQVGAAFLQFFSRQTGKSINSMDLNENYQKIKNSSRIEAICIPIDSSESTWTTDIDRTQSICMATSMQNPNNAPSSENKVTVHMAYWDNLTKQIRYRQGKVGANPGDFGFTNVNRGSVQYKTNSQIGDNNRKKYWNNGTANDSMLDLQGAGSDWGTQDARYDGAYDSISSKNENNMVKAQRIYRVAGTSLGSNYANAYQVTTKYQGGKYVDIGVLPSTSTSTTPTVVICWYDGVSKNLVLSYDDPKDSDIDKENGMYKGKWQMNAGVVSTSGGSYCRMAIDSDDGIHIAHYDNLTADLLYTYVPVSEGVPQINSARTITVDSFLSVGTWCTIDVAKDPEGNHVPQIGYFVPACEDTSAAARIAYPVLFDESKYPTLAGAEAEKFTGNWEISTVPTSNIPIIDRVNVGVYKNALGVIQEIPTGGSQYKKTSDPENNTFPVSDSTTVFGNGTTNPAVVYSIDDGPIELAQKK